MEIKIQKWLGRQIEFRDNTDLEHDSIVYQGRIISIAPDFNLYAIAQITHERQIECKQIYPKKYFLYKTVVTKYKYPFKNIEKELYHLVKLTGQWNMPRSGHWKSQGIIRQGDIFDRNWNYYCSLAPRYHTI